MVSRFPTIKAVTRKLAVKSGKADPDLHQVFPRQTDRQTDRPWPLKFAEFRFRSRKLKRNNETRERDHERYASKLFNIN